LEEKTETKTDHFQPYEILPPAETPVWRYMSLAQLLSLLHTQALFLCRSDLFEDQFEGSFTEGSLRDHEKEWGTEFPENLIQLSRWTPCCSFVSCWCASTEESAALWRIYGPSLGSCAIVSTVGALQKHFPETTETVGDILVNQAIRKIQYIDYGSVHPYLNDMMGPLCYKRRAFSYEQEIRVIRQEFPTGPSRSRPEGRAIIMGEPPEERGKQIKVELNEMLSAVHLAPSSPNWLKGVVTETLQRFELSTPCYQSNLDDLPAYGALHRNF
jgi:hypothetical protein